MSEQPDKFENVSLDERLSELIRKQEKQLLYTRIAGISALVLVLAVVITCLIIVPKAVYTLEQVDHLIADASTTIENANTTLSGFDAMAGQIETAASGINSLVDENSDVLTDSMSKLNSIDFEGLNKAISDLQTVVEPMARFFGNFR